MGTIMGGELCLVCELKYGFAAVSVAIFLACVIEESLLGLLIGWCPVIGLYVAISVFTYLRQR